MMICKIKQKKTIEEQKEEIEQSKEFVETN
jgi:hypothetical protein